MFADRAQIRFYIFYIKSRMIMSNCTNIEEMERYVFFYALI